MVSMPSMSGSLPQILLAVAVGCALYMAFRELKSIKTRQASIASELTSLAQKSLAAERRTQHSVRPTILRHRRPPRRSPPQHVTFADEDSSSSESDAEVEANNDVDMLEEIRDVTEDPTPPATST